MSNDTKVHVISPENLEAVYSKRLKFISEANASAATYENAIIVAGYAAFFALWSAVADDVSKTARNASAAMMCASLIIFVGWTIAAMIARHSTDKEFARAIKESDDLLDEIQQWETIERKKANHMMKFQRWWGPTFVPTLALGFAAAIALIIGSASVILG